VSTLCNEGNAGLALNKEARKLAMRYVREQKTIREKQRLLSTLTSNTVSNKSSSTGQFSF